MEMFDLESYLIDAGKQLLYWLVGIINSVLDAVLELFPSGEGMPHLITPSNFADDHHILSTLVTTLSWCLPLQFIMLCITTLSAFLFVYFCAAPVMRLLKIVK